MMRQGADRAPLSERGNDLYESPACAVEALLRVEPVPHQVWEPCAGRGAISRLLSAAGHAVIAHDLVAYPGADVGITTPIDFMKETAAPAGVRTILTNPPFQIADDFIRHGLSLGCDVIVLMRLMALEGAKRSDLIDKHLVRVWAGRERLPAMHRENWSGPRVSSATLPYCWMIFTAADRGDRPIELRRMSWRS